MSEIAPVVSEMRGTFTELEHQIAALEVRLAELAAGTQPPTLQPQGGDHEAWDVLDRIQAEHARIRARFQVISAYEERIRRLESAVPESARRKGAS